MDLKSLFLQQQGAPASVGPSSRSEGPPADQPPDPLAAPPPYNLYGYGQQPAPEAPPPGMVERGLNATGDAANAVGGASAEVVNKALKAAEDAFNSVIQGAGEQGGKAADAATNWWDQLSRGAKDAAGAAAQPFQEFGRDFSEGFNTGQMNKALGVMGEPPVPPRDREDPYYGREYPSLKRPQPGQDWEPPGQGPVRGEELGWPYYMPQAPRQRYPLKGRPPLNRT